MKREIFISDNNYQPVMDYIFECREKTDLETMNRSTEIYSKESLPFYELIDVKFNSISRIAKLTFYKTVKYRTIEKYITRNYVRYPVYSEWKSKHSEIKKTVRLNNSDLENLVYNEDGLIKKFALEIVYKLNNPELFPSWYLREYYKNELSAIVNTINNDTATVTKNLKYQISQLENKIAELTKTKIKIEKKAKKIDKKYNRINKKIEAIKDSGKNLFLCIISFGIYLYINSKYRKAKLLAKSEKLKVSIETFSNSLNEAIRSIKEVSDRIMDTNKKIEQQIKDSSKKISDYNEIYRNRIATIQPLNMDINHAGDDFIPLKSISAFNKEQIIGCYIIKNNENGKCYVGQSKDVLKRLRQHFKGTEPTNIIFAKDYFSSKFEKKEDLFSVKIIPCQTKDELDRTERMLIEEYGAREIGYNSTVGNK